MNAREALFVPEALLDAYPEAVSVMISENILVREGPRVSFFHESFFDFMFARQMASNGFDLVSHILNREQSLFLRSQIRQFLTYQREISPQDALQNIRSILTMEAILGPNIETYNAGQVLVKEPVGGHPKHLHQDSAYFEHKYLGPVGVLTYCVDTSVARGPCMSCPGVTIWGSWTISTLFPIWVWMNTNGRGTPLCPLKNRPETPYSSTSKRSIVPNPLTRRWRGWPLCLADHGTILFTAPFLWMLSTSFKVLTLVLRNFHPIPFNLRITLKGGKGCPSPAFP